MFLSNTPLSISFPSEGMTLAIVSYQVACPIQPARHGVIDKLNAEWHKPALLIYMAIVLAHWAEHLVQAFQVYVLHWPLKESLGLLGMPFRNKHAARAG